VSIDFTNPSGSLPRKDEYIIYFSVESTLPTDPPTSLVLNPSSYVLNGSNSFIPKTIVKATSLHKGETQSLVKMSIKDRFNQVLLTDYIKLVCSPQTTVIKKANFPVNNNNDNTGPNGGSIMTIIKQNNENIATSDLISGMVVEGPGVTSKPYVISILSDDSIELSQKITSPPSTISLYSFIRTTSCLDAETLRTRNIQPRYVILDSTNNWTYKSNNQIIAQFIREDINDSTISVVLLAKNQSTLPTTNEKADIPEAAMVYASGRVNQDQYCIS
jgi:hypothetical protein